MFPRAKKAPGKENARLPNWFPGTLEAYRAGSTRLLAGQILFEPVDVVVAVDDGGFADQRTE
jgi:hypothetical protein